MALPVRELIENDAGIEQLEQKIGLATDGHGLTRIDSNKKDQQSSIVEQLKLGMVPPGSEFLAPFFYAMEDLFRYLPENAFCAMIEPNDISKQADEWFGKIEQGRGVSSKKTIRE